MRPAGGRAARGHEASKTTRWFVNLSFTNSFTHTLPEYMILSGVALHGMGSGSMASETLTDYPWKKSTAKRRGANISDVEAIHDISLPASRRLQPGSSSSRPVLPKDMWLPLTADATAPEPAVSLAVATCGGSPDGSGARPQNSGGSTKAAAGIANPMAQGLASDGDGAPLVAAFLAGPVRSLLTPSVHRSIANLFWGAFGGRRVLFARLFDVHSLDAPGLERLLCVLRSMLMSAHRDESNARLRYFPPAGEWSAPTAAGKSFLPNASVHLRCRFASHTQLAEFPYMVQSLERQLNTLRACFDRMSAYEATWGVRFDWILRTRTDTAFLRPVRPYCTIHAGTVHHARSFAKGSDVHHMFADHAAVVPRTLGDQLFRGVASRLATCAARGELMPASFSEPESFIHHALIALGVQSASAAWLAPLVVSTDGRMGKWCGRYTKLGVAEVRALGPSQGSCENGMLNPNGRWLEVAAAAAPSPLASELRARSCATASVTKPGWLSTQKPRAQHGTHGTHGTHGMHSMNGRSPQTGAGGRAAACTWANGCCARHPGVCRDHISSPSRSQNAPTPSSSSGR